MLRQLFVLTFFLIVPSVISYAQELEGASLEDVFLLRNKQISEFILRFNFDDIKLEVSEEELQENRIRRIIRLCDEDLVEINEDLVQDFAERSINGPKLAFLQEDWYAKVRSKVLYCGEERELFLVFQLNIELEASHWMLVGVIADFLELHYKKPSRNNIIPPNSGDTNFVSAWKIFQEPDNVTAFGSDCFIPDHLSIFYHVVQNGDLTLVQPEDVQFLFLQIPDYVFAIDFFNRETHNSGWLISDIKRIDQVAKFRYLLKELNVTF